MKSIKVNPIISPLMNIKPAFLYFIISILAFTAPITVLACNNTNGNNSNESGGNIDKKIIGQRSYGVTHVDISTAYQFRK